MSNTNKQRAIWLAATIAVLIGIWIAFAANKPPVSTDKLGAKHERVIFDISSKIASTYRDGESDHILIMKVPHIEEIKVTPDNSIDEPKDIKIISVATFKKLWSRGSNSFSMDPPNAVLSANNRKTTIVTLTGTQIQDEAISYTFKILHGNVHSRDIMNHVSLTVDSIVI